MDRKYETPVYLNDRPCGTIRVVDGQLLLYPLNRSERHLTTQSLDEVVEFYAKEKEMIKKPCLVPLKDMTYLLLVAELDRISKLEKESMHPAVRAVCQNKMDAIMFLLDEQKSR